MIETIKNSLGEAIDFSLRKGTHNSERSDWVVVLGHGVTGDKDRPVISDTANALNAAGFDTFRFSFSGNGESEGHFVDSNVSKEVSDLGAVLDAVSKTYSKICYIGHSMGAAIGVVRAAGDQRIDALVSIAGMVDTKAFAETEFGEETPDEGLMWEEPDCPLSSSFMKDLCVTIGSVESLVEVIEVPWLLVHGLADDVVLPKDTKRVKEIKGVAAEVFYVDGADHSFNEPGHKQALVNGVVEWLSKLPA